LVSTWIFWLALLVPILFGMTLALLIAYSSELGDTCFRAGCVQSFFEVFKFPIAITGLALPLVAMVAAIHRSNEAALQIKITSSQYEEAISNNRFGNYLKHREGFEKLIAGYCADSVHGEGCRIVVRSASLYGRMFPGSGFNNVSWTGQCDEKRLELGNMSAKIIVFQAAASREDFDFFMFMKCLDAMVKLFQINYFPYAFISVESLEEKVGLEVLIPGYSSKSKALIFAVSDCLALLALFRSYVGINKSDDLVVAKYLENLEGNLSEYLRAEVVSK
jgi:hypothetical protein